MFSSRILFYSSTLVFLISNYSAKSQDGGGSNYGDGSSLVPPPPSPTDQSSACNNCTICQYPCHPQPPPTGYQPYGPPPPPSVGQVNCPPAAPVTCCGGQYNYPPPTPFYHPYNNYSGAAALMQRLSPMTSYVSTWPPAVLFYCILLFIFH